MSREDLPQKFEDLKPTELYRSAIEDFALPVDEEDKNKKTVLLAAFLEGGVTWNDYVSQHPEVAGIEPEVAPSIEEDNAPVVNEEESKGVTEEEKLLIKMERKNPVFEVAGYRFTEQNPYALVSLPAADRILKEDGFRQAYPSEVQEFYS